MEKRFFIHDYHEQAILILPSNLKRKKNTAISLTAKSNSEGTKSSLAIPINSLDLCKFQSYTIFRSYQTK